MFVADDTGTPKTTNYQLALDILALCVEKSPDAKNAAATLIKIIKGCQSKGCFDVGKITTLDLYIYIF